MIADRFARGVRDLTPSGTLREPPDWLWDAFGAAPSYSGKNITQESSMAAIAVFAAVRIRSEDIGSLPLKVYRELNPGRQEQPKSKLWGLLHDEANPEMSAGEVWEIVSIHLDLWGNAFLFKERDTFGRVSALWPIKPSRIRVGRLNGQRVFQLGPPDNVLGADKGVPSFEAAGTEQDFLHIRGTSLDGLLGLSPIAQARQAIGSMLAAEEYQARFYANNGRPSGVLQTDQKLSPEARDRLAAQWAAAHAGLQNAAKVAILEDGLKWQTTALPPDDQQFIEQQNWGVAQIARLFRMPPSKLNAEKSGSMTYSTVQAEAADYVTGSLRPTCIRIERSILRDGDIMARGPGLTPRFDMDDLLRGDMLTRYQAHQRSILDGWRSPNEVRNIEDENPVDGLDYYVSPRNVPSGQTPQGELELPDDGDNDELPATPDPAMNGHSLTTGG